MSLKDKEHSARRKFVGRKVRRIYDTGAYRECQHVIAHGPPSGWTCTYDLRLKGGGNILVDRMRDVEIEQPST